VAVAPWNATQEGADAADWAEAFRSIWKSPLPILSGGGYAVPIPLQPNWPNLKHLITVAYNTTVKAATKAYCGHLYALSNSTEMASEMNHAKTVDDLSHFVEQVALAKSINRKFILGKLERHCSFVLKPHIPTMAL
jgi:hypothetical protein